MDRANFLSVVLAVTASASRRVTTTMKWTTIAGIAVPDTQLANEATAIARSSEPIEIFNHSLRTYLFAEIIARAKNIPHDAEIVYIASILHDTGLSARFMSANYPFEVDGANVARKLLAKHRTSEVRSSLAWDAIALHDNGGIAQHKQNEVSLVNSGVSADFGAFLDIMTRSDIQAVLEAAPRTGFINTFVHAAARVAKKKPLASAHSFVADVGYRKVPNFSLPNFCDEVKEDPFASYAVHTRLK